MRLLLILTLVMAPLASWGQTLNNSQACTGAAGKCLTIDEAQTTDTAVALNTKKYYTLIFDADNGQADPATAQIQLYGPCADDDIDGTKATASTYKQVCEKLLIDADKNGGLDDVTLDGSITATTNRRTIYKLPGGLYWVDIVTAPGSGEDATVSFEEN